MPVISYKCPNCGGDLVFDPNSQSYKCAYCFSSFSEDILSAQEPNKGEQGSHQEEFKAHDAVLYTCPSCGAEIVTEETTAATLCYYCHNPVVFSGKLSGNYQPDKIIPFKMDQEEAVNNFLKYVRKHRLVPRAFFNKSQIEKITGVYFPFWIYDCTVSGQLEARAKKIRVYRMGDKEYTETKIYDIERAGTMRFKELTKNALKKANRQLVEGVQPYSMEELKDFSMGYLSGFQAEKRDMEKRDFDEEIRQEIKEYAEKRLLSSVFGYASVNTQNFSMREENTLCKYILLPVWTLTYKGKNEKLYYYAMNGQTNKVCGKLPVAYHKLIALFAAVAAPVCLLLLAGGYFLW